VYNLIGGQPFRPPERQTAQDREHGAGMNRTRTIRPAIAYPALLAMLVGVIELAKLTV
jgi:hypothetical protein